MASAVPPRSRMTATTSSARACCARQFTATLAFCAPSSLDVGTHTCGACGTTTDKIDSWHNHLTQYIKSISPCTLVASDYDLSNTIVDLAISHGGWALIDYTDATYPVVSTGFKNQWGCPSDPGEPNFEACWEEVRTWIRDGWATGLQMGGPFHEYKAGHPGPTVLGWYFQDLRQHFDGVQTWQDEPGAEITAQALPDP